MSEETAGRVSSANPNVPCASQFIPPVSLSSSTHTSVLPRSSFGDGLGSRASSQIFVGHGKVDFFFRNVPPAVRGKIKFDQEALYSVTDSSSADSMTSIISRLPGVSPSSTITDLTACVGGNVISFARVFRAVNAVEIDAVRFDLLRHNVHEILGEGRNIVFRHGDAIEQVALLRQDIIFMDPPWGGTDYMKCSGSLKMYLSGRNIGELCENLFRNHARYIAVKVPVNFDVEDFRRLVSAPVEVRRDFRKMMLLLIDYGGCPAGSGSERRRSQSAEL